MAWFLIACIILNIFVNITFLLVDVVKGIIQSVKKNWALLKARIQKRKMIK